MRLPASPLAAGCCDDPVKDTGAPSPKNVNFPPATGYGQAPAARSSPPGGVLSSHGKGGSLPLKAARPVAEGPVEVTELQLSAPDGSLCSHMGSTRGPGVSVAQAGPHCPVQAVEPGSQLAVHTAAPLPLGPVGFKKSLCSEGTAGRNTEWPPSTRSLWVAPAATPHPCAGSPPAGPCSSQG